MRANSVVEYERQWGVPVTLMSEYDAEQAHQYLKTPGKLAVIPSRLDNSPLTVLECLVQRIPFVTTDRGGIPELIH